MRAFSRIQWCRDAVIKVAALFAHSVIQRKAFGKILKHERPASLTTAKLVLLILAWVIPALTFRGNTVFRLQIPYNVLCILKCVSLAASHFTAFQFSQICWLIYT